MRLLTIFALTLTAAAVPAFASPQSMEREFKKWCRTRPAACSEDLDSKSYVSSKAKRTALVLHGYSANPKRMAAITKLLVENGYNVLAPRLSGHFNANLRDLDGAGPEDW